MGKDEGETGLDEALSKLQGLSGLILISGDGVGALNDNEKRGVAWLLSDLANQAVEARRATVAHAHN